jgi:hypothetical protein
MSSSMLEQAVIDAQSLREAAIKSAQQEVLNKYSNEIKQAVDTLLEQDDEDLSTLGMSDDQVERDEIVDEIPMKAMGGEELCPCPEDQEEVELDLDALKAAVDGDEEMSLDMGLGDIGAEEDEMMYEATEEQLLELLSPSEDLEEASKPDFLDLDGDGDKNEPMSKASDDKKEVTEDKSGYTKGDPEETETPTKAREKNPIDYEKGQVGDEVVEEELELDEEVLRAAIEEILKVDVENVPRGDLGTTHPTKAQQIHAVEVALAADEDTEVSEEEDKLEKMIGDLQEQVKTLKVENNSLLKEHNDLKSVAVQATKKFEEINLSNAKLNYTNRVLKSDSLNERQKEKIVKAISDAKTITESKLIYDTVSDSMVTSANTAPKNLKEALNNKNNNTLVIKSNTKDQAPKSKSTIDRMKKLAGII